MNNITGRVVGGLLILISLGWLASIAGLRPGWLGGNTLNSNAPKTGVTNLTAPGNIPAGTTVKPANGTKTGVSSFNAGSTGTATKATTGTAKAEVEDNSRTAGDPTKPAGTKATGANAAATASPTTPPPAAPAAAAPVSAGW